MIRILKERQTDDERPSLTPAGITVLLVYGALFALFVCWQRFTG